MESINAPTIKGMPFSAIIEKLQENFPSNIIKYRDYDGTPYISVDKLRERLDMVIGKEHYNEIYSDINVTTVKETFAVTCKCRIEFLDDDFNICLIKESTGGSTIQFPKNENGEAGLFTTSIPNDYDVACQDAFKRICKKLGIGKLQLEEAKKGIFYENVLLRNITNKNSYIICDVLYRSSNLKLLVFKKNMDVFLKTYGNTVGKQIMFYGSEKLDKYNKLQLVFNHPFHLPNQSSLQQVQSTKPTKEDKKESHIDLKKFFPSETDFEETFKSNSKLMVLQCSKGSYYMTCVYKNEKITIVFLKEQIKEIPENVWNHFQQEVNKKATLIKGVFFLKDNILLFKKFI